MEHLYIISTSISIITSSISVLMIYQIVYKILKPETRIKKIVLMLLSYMYIFHFMNINNMEFLENCIMSLAVLLYIIAAQKIEIENKRILGTIICVLAAFMYQGTISIFLLTTVLLVILQNNTKKQFWKKIGIILLVLIITSVLNLIFMYVARNNIDTVQPERINLNIIENVKTNIIKLPILVLNSLRLFPKYLHICFIMLLLLMVCIESIRDKKIQILFESVLLIVLIYGVCFSMSIIYPTCIFNGNGRIFAAVGASFSIIGIHLLCRTNIFENRKTRTIFLVIVVLYFIINIFNTMYITSQMKINNEIYRDFSEQIIEAIDKYEIETGEKIEKFAIWYYRDETAYEYMPQFIVNNTSKVRKCLYNHTVLEMYTGKKLEYEGVEEQIRQQYFKNQEEKMLCIGNKLYISKGY